MPCSGKCPSDQARSSLLNRPGFTGDLCKSDGWGHCAGHSGTGAKVEMGWISGPSPPPEALGRQESSAEDAHGCGARFLFDHRQASHAKPAREVHFLADRFPCSGEGDASGTATRCLIARGDVAGGSPPVTRRRCRGEDQATGARCAAASSARRLSSCSCESDVFRMRGRNSSVSRSPCPAWPWPRAGTAPRCPA